MPSREIVAEGKFIRFLKEDGWEYVERSNCSAIVIIAGMTDKHEVILTEQYRLPVKSSVIEFPAGLVGDVHADEDLLKAAERELWEETGYEAQRMEIEHCGPVSSGLTSDLMTIFLAYGLIKTGDGGGDESENIRTHVIPLDEADQWLHEQAQSGFLVDAKVYAGLHFLRRTLNP